MKNNIKGDSDTEQTTEKLQPLLDAWFSAYLLHCGINSVSVYYFPWAVAKFPNSVFVSIWN